MASPLDKKRVKTSIYNYCKLCDYTASQKSNWERHLLTKKHKKKCHLSVTCVPKNEYKTSKNYSCEQCGKNYKSRNGLWKHKKTCVPVNMKVESKPAPIIQNITNNITNNNITNLSNIQSLILNQNTLIQSLNSKILNLERRINNIEK